MIEKTTEKSKSDEKEKTAIEKKTTGKPVEVVDQDLIQRSIRFINEKANETLYKGSIEIGEYILKNFFDDSMNQASSRNPRKSKSYRMLCQSSELVVQAGTLSIMVRVAGQERWFKKDDVNTESLSYTHKAELIKLEDDNPVKKELIKQCIEESLSSRELSDLVRAERKGLAKEWKPTPLKYFAYIDRVLKNAELPGAFDDVDRLLKMKPEIRNDLRERTEKFSEELKRVQSKCKSLLKNLDKVEGVSDKKTENNSESEAEAEKE